MQSSRELSIVALALSILLVIVVGAIGSLFEPGYWYQNLIQPEVVPPSWVFSVAWSLLYLMMALAAWLVYKKGGGLRRMFVPLALYVVHLVFNAAWSGLFFGLHLLDLALLDLMIVLALAVAVTRQFLLVSKTAGTLMLPYLAWLAFAFWMNLRFWQLNPAEAILTYPL